MSKANRTPPPEGGAATALADSSGASPEAGCTAVPQRPRRVTTRTLRSMTARGERITMVTAYDVTFARLLDEGGADVLLVGDSLGMVVQGRDSTLPVTLDDMLYHSRAVARGAERAHIVADMPFMSYQVSVEEALRNAGRLLSEGGAHAVKLEGGEELVPTIERMVAAGIPVMGHVGLTPQSVHAMGGFRVQGKSEADANRVLADARAVTKAGAYALVLEGIPAELAARIRREVHVPTIGIGAGAECDGQVLVCYDLLGLTPGPTPKFVKQFEQLYTRGVEAMARFREEVRDGRFPSEAHTYGASKHQPPRPSRTLTHPPQSAVARDKPQSTPRLTPQPSQHTTPSAEPEAASG